MRQIIWALVIALPLVFLPGVVAQQSQQELGWVTSVDPVAQAQIEGYWTAEMMASAVPMTPPERLFDEYAQSGSAAMSYAPPGGVNGWDPSTGPYVEQRMTSQGEVPQLLTAPQAFGTAPTNPLAGPYGPFQRWAMHGRYLQFPRSIHGKLFFSFGASNFVCSGTVIGRSTIATAGHCVSNGSGVFATNIVFCPSYLQTGANPTRGCWAVQTVATSGSWHTSGDPDYDYACGVTANAGTVVANKIGNVTGWAGRAWNYTDVSTITFGYPQAAPFNGLTIQQTASVEWYNWDATAGNQVSKVIGSDLTPGASGGGWFLSWRHPNDERPDTDGNNATDPAGAGGPYINGVNSHKRCAGGSCVSPPTAVAGVFWQEMTSPPFRNTAASGESEDVFAVCLANANNNASAPAAAKR